MRPVAASRPGAWSSGVALSLLVFVSLFGLVPWLGESALASLFVDDAFYYFTIARHVAEGDGYTFDGRHLTNGFQPLWLWLLVPIFRLVPGDAAALRVVLGVQALLVALACLGCFRILDRRIERAAAVAAALTPAAFLASTAILRSGMESSLLLVLLVLLWHVATELPHGSRRRFLAAGCLLAALFLTRVEAILLCPVLALWWWRRLGRDRLALLLLGLPPALGALLFAAWSYTRFGIPVPVSGLVKSLWLSQAPPGLRLRHALDVPWLGQSLVCRVLGHPSLVTLPAWALAAYAALVLVAVVTLFRARHGLRQSLGLAQAGLPLVLGIALTLVQKAALGWLSAWHPVGILLATGALVGVVLHGRPRAQRLGVTLVLAGCLLRLPFEAHYLVGKPESGSGHQRLEAARWSARHVPASEPIGSWNAGGFAYFARRPVVNLDGLVNDASYYERLRRAAPLAEYLSSESIEWVADQACGTDPSIDHYLRRSGALDLVGRFERMAYFYHEGKAGKCPGFALWRLDRARTGSASATP